MQRGEKSKSTYIRTNEKEIGFPFERHNSAAHYISQHKNIFDKIFAAVPMERGWGCHRKF